jgi:hypothetical protein
MKRWSLDLGDFPSSRFFCNTTSGALIVGYCFLLIGLRTSAGSMRTVASRSTRLLDRADLLAWGVLPGWVRFPRFSAYFHPWTPNRQL